MNELSKMITVSDIPGIGLRARAPRRAHAVAVRDLIDVFSLAPVEGIVTDIRPGPARGLAMVELGDPRRPYARLSVGVPAKIAATLRRGRRFTIPPREKQPIELSFWKRLRGSLSFQPVSETVQIPEYLPLFNLHCPKVKGCKASYTSRRDEKQSVGFEVKFSGIGFGKGKKVQITNVQTYTSDANCIQVSAEAELEATFVDFYLNDELLVSGGINVDIKKVDRNHLKDAPIPPAQDKCGLSASHIRKLEKSQGFVSGSFDLSALPPNSASVEKVDQIKHDRVQKTKIELPTTISGVPVSFALSSETTLSTEVSVKCSVVSGKKYYWYCAGEQTGDKSIECFWSVA